VIGSKHNTEKILCFWTFSIVLSLSKNTVMFIFRSTTFRRPDSVSETLCFEKNKQDGVFR
jgi:hypothetical protein